MIGGTAIMRAAVEGHPDFVYKYSPEGTEQDRRYVFKYAPVAEFRSLRAAYKYVMTDGKK